MVDELENYSNIPTKRNGVEQRKQAEIPRHTTVLIDDIRTLLEMVASPNEPDYSEVEAIAKRNGFVFDAEGTLKEAE